MTSRLASLLSVCLLLPVTTSNGCTAVDPQDLGGRPNVVLIFADDLSYGEIDVFNQGCPFSAPGFDQMKREGARRGDGKVHGEENVHGLDSGRPTTLFN
ncbi:MAG: hypothetical protein AAGA03_18025, partial [Planctomycetota bacterium]